MWRFWALSSVIFAQGGYVAPLAHELGVGVVLHSYGWGVGVAGHRWKDDRTGRAWQVDLTSYRLREEVRIRSAYQDQGGRDYVFGKVNYVYLLEGVFSYQRVLLFRSAVSAGQVSLLMGAGPALGLTKPYYIEIAVPISATQAIIKVDTYDPQRYSYLDIVGEADFYLGFDKLRATPGVVGQGAVEVNFGRNAALFRGLLIGVRLQAFSAGIQSLYEKPPRQVWVSGVLAFYVGNAWK
jgi:hypothetical protein